MKNNLSLGFALSFGLAFNAGSAEFRKPQPPVTIEAFTAEVVPPGASITATVEIPIARPAQAIRLRAHSSGAPSTAPVDTVLAGPWASGQRAVHEFTAAPGGAGAGLVTVTAELLDASGQPTASTVGHIFTDTDADGTWASASSPTDLNLRRLANLQNRGRITPAEGAAEVEKVLKGTVAIDDKPRTKRPLNGHELRIQRQFESQMTNQIVAAAPGNLVAAAAATITVGGHVEWTDSAGGRHGLPLATVEIRDSDVIGSELIATTMTDAVGNYSITVTHDDGLLQGDPDIFVRVYARSPVADIKPDTSSAGTYFKESPTTDEVADGANLTINFTTGNVNDNDTVYSVHHALVVIGAYAGTLAGSTPSQVDTRFPTTRSTSLFNGTQLHILRPDRWDWDVIHHEYGHYFMAIHGFQNNPGGNHGFNDNLAQTRGSKDVGVRLAWGEGWPTFFGTAGQSATGARALGVPNVGDTAYQDTEDQSTSLNLESSNGLGEDNEVSVMAALWDLYDGANDGEDKISLSDRTLFNLLKSSGAKTVGAAWEAFAAVQSTEGKTRVGAIFGQALIAPQLVSPAENDSLGMTPPAFMWTRNGGGVPNPLNDFRIRFYKNDFSSVIFEKELGDVDTYTPDATEWDTIRNGDAVVKWVVEGRNTTAPATPGGALGRYWSAARSLGGIRIVFVIDDTGSMSEEIGGVRTALQAFIDQVAMGLPPGTEPPTMQLVTFKDNVSPRLITKDLGAMRSAVGALVASGGGDCPEFGAQALQFAAENIGRNGTVLFATDASSQPGVDIGAVISSLRAKGVSVNTILSGDCTGISSAFARAGEIAAAGGEIADSGEQKPGDDDPPQEPIDDPGQSPIDVHGDTAEAATELIVAGGAVAGMLGVAGDEVDYFRFSTRPDATVVVQFHLEAGFSGSTVFALLAGDGVSVLQSQTLFNATPAQFLLRPTAGASNYFVRVSRATSTGPAVYSLLVKEDPFATLVTAVEMFSTISAQSGGVFLVRDGVNAGDEAEYAAAILNVISSTLGPVVLAADPNALQQGTTLAVTLRGRNSNWRSGSTVAFSGAGITVNSVEVRSATDLTVLVSIDPAAPLGFQDVTVTTPLGTQTETARGVNVVTVASASSVPAILSVEPDQVAQSDRRNLVVRGINTAWNTNSTVAFGVGITVESVHVTASNLLETTITVAADARIGFYTISVATPDLGTQSKSRAVFVNSLTVGLPEITGLTPAEARRSQTLDVDVAGLNTHFVEGRTVAAFGAGVNVLAVQVSSPTNARVRVAIAPDAAVGFRDVSLTTDSEVVVRLQGFFVNEGPTGIRPLKEQVLADLSALRDSVSDRHDGDKLDDAIKHLTKSLAPDLWVDQTHLDRKHGEKVFHEEKEAAHKLLELIKNKKSEIPDAVLQGFIDRLVAADRLLAEVAIDEAEVAGVNPKKIAHARKELEKAEEELAKGHPDHAIEHYGHAWKEARHAKIQDLQRLPNGSVDLKILGFSGESYRIQTSTNLNDWVDLGEHAVRQDGELIFKDTNPASGPMRFYRILEP